MAVECDGTAYVQFARGAMWRLGADAASCEVTPFAPAQQGFTSQLGLAVAPDATGTETLFFAGVPLSPGTGTVFGWLDASTFVAHPIASLPGAAGPTLLTEGPAGDLYAFFAQTIGLVNKTTGKLTTQWALPPSVTWSKQPFVFFGAAFYFFDLHSSGTDVLRWELGARSVTRIGNLPTYVFAVATPRCGPN